MKAFTRPPSVPAIDSSSAISTIQTPWIWMDASFDPSSGIWSVNHGSPNTRNAVDFLMPCGPSRIRQVSALTPGDKMRATAEIIQRVPTAAAYDDGSTPRYVVNQLRSRDVQIGRASCRERV